MDEALRARLRSEVPGVPVDWGMSMQGINPPRIVLTRVSGGADYTSEGPSGYSVARVQVDCYGASVGAAKTLARSVKAAISGWRNATTILGVFLDAERDLLVQRVAALLAIDRDPLNRATALDQDWLCHGLPRCFSCLVSI